MKILSIDGGGLMGVVPAYVLSRVGDLSKFDMCVGTSIGSIIAARAAYNTVDDAMVNMFLHRGSEIFHRRLIDMVRPWRTPRYDDSGLNTILKEMLPGTLGDMQKPFAATTFSMSHRRLKVFSTLNTDDQTEDLWQVCRMSSAAQTYFAPWKGHSDGGPLANNPCMVAIREVSRHSLAPHEEVELLSLGTGEDGRDHTVDTTVGWPLWSWAAWIIPALLEGAGNTMHTMFARGMKLKRFTRLNFTREPSWKMDNPETPGKALVALHTQMEEMIQVVKAF